MKVKLIIGFSLLDTWQDDLNIYISRALGFESNEPDAEQIARYEKRERHWALFR